MTATTLSAPGLVVAAAAAIVMLRLKVPTAIIAIASASIAGVVGSVVIAVLGLNLAQPDPDAFFDPTGLIIIGAILVLAIIGLVAGALAGRVASRR